MAYRAEIQIGVKGARSLEEVRKKIDQVASAIDRLNTERFSVAQKASKITAFQVAQEQKLISARQKYNDGLRESIALAIQFQDRIERAVRAAQTSRAESSRTLTGSRLAGLLPATPTKALLPAAGGTGAGAKAFERAAARAQKIDAFYKEVALFLKNIDQQIEQRRQAVKTVQSAVSRQPAAQPFGLLPPGRSVSSTSAAPQKQEVTAAREVAAVRQVTGALTSNLQIQQRINELKRTGVTLDQQLNDLTRERLGSSGEVVKQINSQIASTRQLRRENNTAIKDLSENLRNLPSGGFVQGSRSPISGNRDLSRNARQALQLESQLNNLKLKGLEVTKAETALGRLTNSLNKQNLNTTSTELKAQKEFIQDLREELALVRQIAKSRKDGASRQTGSQRGGGKLKNAVSSGIIGGAFPLLFGQGPAAAVGGGLGGFGGGLAGGQLGFGLSLVGTQIGAAVDQVITSITTLSSSLREPTAALAALGEAGIKVNSSVALQIQQLESAGKAYEAQTLLLDTVAEKLGVDAVAQLQALDDAQEQTQQHISDFKSALTVELLPALTLAAQGINVLAGTLTKLSNIKIPIPGGEDVTLDIPKLIRNAAFSQLFPGGPGLAQVASQGLSMLPKPELQAPELTPTQKLAQQTKQLKATTGIGSSRLENEITELIGKNLKRNNDLTDATVVANKRLIISKTAQNKENKLSAAIEEKRLNRAITTDVLAKAGLDQAKIRNEASNQHLQLTNSVNAAQEAKNKKLGSGASKLAKQTEQLARQEQQARNFTASLERQLAQSKVAGTQQAQKLRIEHAYEQTVERIAKLKNQDSATEQLALANQIRKTELANFETTEARKQAEAIRSAVAPIKGIREGQEASLAASKEYNRLLMEGVLPSEAKRITDFNAQVDALLRQKEVQISILETDLLRSELSDKQIADTERQIKLLKLQKGEIETEAAKGPGKSDTSDRKTIEDRVAQLKGELTELTKLGNIAVTVADNIGSAFSTAFQGVINGSQTMQEALAGMLKSVGESFVAMAAEIIAKQLVMITLQTILKALGAVAGASGGGGGGVEAASKHGTLTTGALPDLGVGSTFASPEQFAPPTIMAGSGIPAAANGGPVEGGRPYLVGERGPELFVPGQSGGVMRNEDMRSLMGRSPASGGAASMNFSFETTSIGGTEYVSREQLESAMAVTRKQASNDGAKRGMSMTLDKMQNSPRTRTRIGLR